LCLQDFIAREFSGTSARIAEFHSTKDWTDTTPDAKEHTNEFIEIDSGCEKIAPCEFGSDWNSLRAHSFDRFTRNERHMANNFALVRPRTDLRGVSIAFEPHPFDGLNFNP
jgi:hypothetical protein